VSAFSVRPETVAGDPFAVFGIVDVDRAKDEGENLSPLALSPHGCIEGTVYIGHMVHDEETGEEVEVIDSMPCKRCSR
jgi:hypothetical protein